MNTKKIIYWVSTALMCLVFAFSAGMYITNYDMIRGLFPELGFPAWLVAPLAVAKISGIIAILTDRIKILTEWAYAGFLFDAILAFGAHYYAQDGEGIGAVIAIIVTIVSRVFYQFRK